MALKVVWTKRAHKRLIEATEFIGVQWGEYYVASFVWKVFGTIDLIGSFPEMGILEDRKKGIRSFLIVPHHRLFYRVSGTNLIILNIFDQRMDPKKKWTNEA